MKYFMLKMIIQTDDLHFCGFSLRTRPDSKST